MGKGKRLKSKCICGSGKREKDCCKGRKPRTTHIVMEHDKPTIVNSYRISKYGDIQLFTKEGIAIPKNTRLEQSYKKNNGKEKKLVSVPTNSAKNISLQESIKQFDVIFAVDTNTKLSEHHPYKSICSVVRGIVVKNTEEYGIDLLFETIFLSDENIAKPENSGWHRTIQHIKEIYPESYMTMKFGIVVDSDLGELQNYNNKTKPFIDNIFLPPNVHLIYASADVGKENIYNKMIHIADKISNQMNKHLENGGEINDFKCEI